jgi:hypothetical protein
VKRVSNTNDSRWHSKFLEGQSRTIHGADGFLAAWYFALRAAEEAARSERYERPLTVLLVEAASGERQRLEGWLADKLRSTDLICQGSPGQFFILLPETDEASAWEVSQRILDGHPGLTLSLATLSSDSARFDALLYKLDLHAMDWPKVTA